MKNLTLSIDEDTLREARKYAAERDTSVNALVREFLANVTGIDARRKRAVARMRELSETSEFRLSGPWKREDLYDRPTMTRLLGDGESDEAA